MSIIFCVFVDNILRVRRLFSNANGTRQKNGLNYNYRNKVNVIKKNRYILYIDSPDRVDNEMVALLK